MFILSFCTFFPVRGWLDREEKRKYSAGQFWYLISRDWWVTWLQYVTSSATSCEYCKNSSVGTYQRSSLTGIDEAVVCDETFNTNSLDSAVGYDLAGAAGDNCSLGIIIYYKKKTIKNINLFINFFRFD